MSPTKTRGLPTGKLLRISLTCSCIVLLAASLVPETTSTATETRAQIVKAQSSTPLATKDGEAEQALAQAEALRANWTAAALREAIAQYEKAALLYRSSSDFSNAANATLKAGDVYFLTSEYAQALKQYQDAEALAQKAGDWLAQATALSQMGLVESLLGNNDLAEKQVTQALDVFKQHEADRSASANSAYGEALTSQAEITYAKGNFLKASSQLENALKVFQNDRKGEARVRHLRGMMIGTIGETDKAVAELSRARDLAREVNDKRREGLTLTSLGLWYASKQNATRAIELNNEAGEIFRTIGDRNSEAVAVNAIGQAYEALEQHATALPYYMKALSLYESVGALDSVSVTKCVIAMSQFLNRKLDQALASYEDCLKMSRATGQLRIELYAIEGIANVYAAQNRHDLAMKQYQNLQKVFSSLGDLRGEAVTLNSYGKLLLQNGEAQKALGLFNQAFSLSEKLSDKSIMISTLYNLAGAHIALGAHETALSLITKSFALIEEIRGNVASPDYRASYFSAVRPHYDLCVEILMQLHKLRPREGFDGKAFAVSEQSRARLLLDLLSESHAGINAGAVKELVERESRLRGLLRAQAGYQLSLSLSGKDSSELSEVNFQIAQLTSEYQAVKAQLRDQNPRLFSYEQFAPVELERIQKELDSDTMLLEYSLGNDRSYLWAVTANSSDTYVLPARHEIEAAAGEFYKVLTARQGSAGKSDAEYQAEVTEGDKLYFEKASTLSQMLLGAVADRLGSRRLVVVPDGALQLIPFEALPLPSAQAPGPGETSTNFLIATNEVVMLPSASTLIAIRSARNRNAAPGKLVAIIADPVFNRNDDRVQREASPSIVAAASNQNLTPAEQQAIGNLKLARLVHAAEEADAITAAAPWGTTFLAKGFDASRETAMSAEVRDAQIVHLATHGFLNNNRPEFSGIVLSMTDRNGAHKNGLMLLPDIYSLDLSAELAVLSACQTALGKDIKGEGLVGLTHSFMSAGAKSVVASLWKVDDRATAALMADFYDAMLKQGMTPAAALRYAKLKMASGKQWSAPYYWAGFVLQGEYTNHITVQRYTWLRPALVFLFLLILIAAALLVYKKRRQRIRPV